MSSKKGSLTVLLAWMMLLFLTFCLVLVEGARVYYTRVCAVQAVELTEYSVLSEYQRELFEQYGVFFIDLDYEQGEECLSILEERASYFLNVNAGEISTKSVEIDSFRRATDYQGQPFLKQAAELIKVRSGGKILEEMIGAAGEMKLEEIDLSEQISQNHEKFSSEHEGFTVPNITYPSINSLKEAVFGDDSLLSQKTIDRSKTISNRRLVQGNSGKQEEDLEELHLFHEYLFEFFSYYGCEKQEYAAESLEYQLEYIISGKNSDQKNLEQVMWRIFLLRTGSNYLFYHQDGARMAAAETKALALAGFTGNAAVIEACRELFLISQAIEEGILETKKIFSGEKVPFYQEGIFAGFEAGYEEYLYLLIGTINKKDKVYRCMDIVEMEIRKKSGYEEFRMDHCVDAFQLQWTYGYDSLFLDIPFLEGSVYETSITREFYYEK